LSAKINETVLPMKVISLAHSAAFSGSSRLRYHPLAENPELELTLLVPGEWQEYGRRFRPDPPSSPLAIRVCPIRIPTLWRAKWYCHYYPTLASVLNEIKPQVLHLWEEPWSLVALQAARLVKMHFPQTALILETEQNILRRLPPPFEQIRRYTLRRTDMLIARQEEALAVSRECGYSGPATIVEYCVDRTCFRPYSRIDCRKQFNIQGFTVGYVGRLVEEKGLFTVVEALRRCRNDIHFALVGDGPAKTMLQARVQEAKLTDRVTFLGSQPKETIARFLNSVDLLAVMSLTTRSWKEQFGRVIVEAHACGTPVVGSTSGAIPSVVGKGGWIVQEGDAASLADLLDTLATNAKLLKEASDRALENVSRFSIASVSTKLLDAYMRAAEQHRREPRCVVSVG
jgi:glycosyltransferase involved in cell wall biosynthesis